MIACENSGHSIPDDFPEVRKIVEAGVTTKPKKDYELSRYACYLIVQNGDPRKEVIALGQTYFAIQTYRQEVADYFNELDEDNRRLVVRGDIKQWNQMLAETAHNAGVITNEEFAIFQNAGYMGLYGGLDVDDIQTKMLLDQCWRKFYEQCGGYDESMRSGFEDWDFFLSMLETTPEALAGIVEKPLINYRTASASTNIKSMNKRLELMRYIIEKHNNSYRDNITNVLLDIEAISNSRLFGWENEIIHSIKNNQELSDSANDFIKNPSYGDGGMASAVRIVSINK